MNHGEAGQNVSSSTPDSDPCPICLGPMVQNSYLDHCFHRFCYNCIVRWSKVVATKGSCPTSSLKCPLCKTENFSIIHGYDGYSFQQHYINQNFGDRFFFSEAHKYRLQCYYSETGILRNTFNVTRYWRSGMYLHSNRWLESWLRREIQSLMQEEDVGLIVYHVLGVIDSFLRRHEKRHQVKTYEAKQEEFKSLVADAVRPFLTARTDRFVEELELFLASGLNIEAYDDVYKQRLGWNAPRPPPSEAGQANEETPVLPYLYIFDEDSDATD